MKHKKHKSPGPWSEMRKAAWKAKRHPKAQERAPMSAVDEIKEMLQEPVRDFVEG